MLCRSSGFTDFITILNAKPRRPNELWWRSFLRGRPAYVYDQEFEVLDDEFGSTNDFSYFDVTDNKIFVQKDFNFCVEHPFDEISTNNIAVNYVIDETPYFLGHRDFISESTVAPAIKSLVDTGFSANENEHTSKYGEKECLSHVEFVRADKKEIGVEVGQKG